MSSPQDTPNDPTKRPAGRPSLSGTAAGTRDFAKTGPGSILQALDDPNAVLSSGQRQAGGIWRRPLVVGGVAAVLAAALWAALRPASAPAPPMQIAANQAAPAKALPRPAPAPPAIPASIAAPPAPAASQSTAPAAVAKLEALPDATTPAAAAPAASSVDTATALAAAAPVAAVVAATKPAPKTAAASRSSQSASARSTTTQRRTATAKTATPVASAAPKAAITKPETSTATRADDPDVELMAALMSHVGTPAAGAAGATLPRTQQATIASLVASCRSKPRAQAEQCQRSICEGYWGKAQACPLRNKPATKTSSRLASPKTAEATRSASAQLPNKP